MFDADWKKIENLFPELSTLPTALTQFQRHADLLKEANSRVRTVASTDSRMFRHYAESLESLRFVGELEGEHICDVGSGGGFPGIIWAIMLPKHKIHLIESNQKKAALLEKIKEKLELGNIEVHPKRAENLARDGLREQCVLVGVRAVDRLVTTVEYTAPLAKIGATIIAPKGTLVQAEIKEAEKAIKLLGCKIINIHKMRDEVSKSISVVKLEKNHPIDESFPRRPGLAKKKPIQ